MKTEETDFLKLFTTFYTLIITKRGTFTHTFNHYPKYADILALGFKDEEVIGFETHY